MKKDCLFIDVFADKPYTGNQLAVFQHADDLTTEQMQQLANEINYSETTFILKNSVPNADFDVRIFTLKIELPFAGHPILGTAHVIFNSPDLTPKPENLLRLKTKVGIIPLTKDKGSIWMKQNEPEFSAQYTDKEEIADLISLTPEDISDDLPIEAVSTGNKMIIIPIKKLEAMRRADGNAIMLKKFHLDQGMIGPYLFTQETINPDAHVHTRFFAPHLGILEDAATGSAAGPLTAYLLKYEVFGKSFEIVNEQGIEMGRPSKILMRGHLEDNSYTIKIGGRCEYVGNGEFEI